MTLLCWLSTDCAWFVLNCTDVIDLHVVEAGACVEFGGEVDEADVEMLTASRAECKSGGGTGSVNKLVASD